MTKIIGMGLPVDIPGRGLVDLFKKFDIDLPADKWGRHGSVAWTLSIPINFPMENMDKPLKDAGTLPDYTFHYVMDPWIAIPLLKNLTTQELTTINNVLSKIFRGYAPEPALIYLLWNRMIQTQNPDYTIRIEHKEDLSEFLKKIKPDQELDNIEKIEIKPESWEGITLDPVILSALDQMCLLFKYKPLSERLPGKKYSKNPFNRISKYGQESPSNPGLPIPSATITSNNSGNASLVIKPRLVHNVSKIIIQEKPKQKISFGVSRKK